MEKRSLELRNVVLEVVNSAVKHREKNYVKLIKGVSCRFESGQLSVVMGASGAGKTSLMGLISGHVDKSSKTSGQILYNGRERNIDTWNTSVAMLEQDDVIYPGQSVEEFVRFSYRCRAKKVLRTVDEKKLIDDVLTEVGLFEAKYRKMETISGGERKRAMLAAEIILGTDVLILDEPTTGLDSNNALEIVYMLKRHAIERNKIVLMTVHQPGPGVCEMFDSFMFMSRGIVIYFGPFSGVDNYLQRIGVENKSALSTAEFMFEVFSDRTIYQEINLQKEKISQITTDALAQAEMDTMTQPIKTVNDRFLNLRLQTNVIFEIIFRTLKSDWMSWRILKGGLLEAIIIGFFTFSLTYQLVLTYSTMLHSGGIFDLKDLPLELESHKDRVNWLVDYIGENVSYVIPLIVSYMLFPLILVSTFEGSSIMSNAVVLNKEIRTGYYTPLTYYSSLLLLETFGMFVRAAMFVGFLSAFNMPFVLSFSVIMLVLAISFAVTIFNIAIRSLALFGINNVIISILRYIPPMMLTANGIVTLVRSIRSSENWIYMLLEGLKIVYFVWSVPLLTYFFEMGFIMSIAELCETTEDENLMKILSFLISIPIKDINQEKVAEILNTASSYILFPGSGRWILYLCSLVSIFCVLSIIYSSIFMRFNPRLRTKLS